MNFMGSTRELLLIHKSMRPVTLTHRVDVMVTPQFYTLKREALPVKYLYQARRIAPSLFVGLLEEGRSYRYWVSKELDSWLFIAYDVTAIRAFLASKGIGVAQVGKLFFAQQALEAFEDPIVLGTQQALTRLGETVVVVPQVALGDQDGAGLFDSRFRPRSGGVSLEGGGSTLLSSKHALLLSTLLLILAGIFVAEGWRYHQSGEGSKAVMEELLTAYPALQSSLQRDNIAQKYRTIDTLERKKREQVKALAGMIFKGVVLTTLTLDNKHLLATFECSTPKVSKRLTTLLKKAQFRVTPVAGTHELKVEGVL